jgi:hypothetical protein
VFLLFMFLRPLKNNQTTLNIRHSFVALAWLLTILISCLTEDTLATLAGILFCTWFLAFRQTRHTDHQH